MLKKGLEKAFTTGTPDSTNFESVVSIMRRRVGVSHGQKEFGCAGAFIVTNSYVKTSRAGL